MAKSLQSAEVWKTRLADKMPPQWAQEIDHFETDMFLKKQGKIDDKLFAETRLRRGAYGQRYDNGSRNDGKEDRAIPYPTADLLKGPNTKWDAPGMERIKIPYGGLTTEQMDVLADLAEEYSDSICHITTRQDVQLHFVHIEDTPSIFRRLAAVGITTREACGNSVRNVTGCPLAGVCPDERFDTTGYADAMFRFLLGHPDVQDFGRKFKISFSGCKEHACALAAIHDLGIIAATRVENGKARRGFEVYVGGGLGAVPFQAQLLNDFVSEEELLPVTQAVCRVFARLGEKKNRNRARIKFLVANLGIDEFRRLVVEEREKLKPDPRWTAFLSGVAKFNETPLQAPAIPAPTEFKKDANYCLWRERNVLAQRQAGYVVVSISLPLGDITSNQLRDLADVCRRFIKDTIRTTVEQNIVLRWVRESDLPALYAALKAIDLVEPWSRTIVDITACPGTDTCKLGVSSSRGLAGELRTQLAEKSVQFDQAVRDLRIKVSGCFNSCGQHHIADIGFYGVSRKVGNYMVPHFQLVLGGQMRENAGAYGLAVTSLPSKAIPKVVERLTDLYMTKREKGESFQAMTNRLGKVAIKTLLDDLAQVPAYSDDPSYYVDWGDVREYSKKDIGIGECAGEIVSLADFGLKTADRELFEAQVAFEAGELSKAANLAFKAMMHAAQGFVKLKNVDISEEADEVAREFKTYYCDTQIFYDPFAGDRFAAYFFKAKDTPVDPANKDHVRKHLEEAQLFIDAGHSCNARMNVPTTSPTH